MSNDDKSKSRREVISTLATFPMIGTAYLAEPRTPRPAKDVASSSNASLASRFGSDGDGAVTFVQAGAGAISRTLQDKVGEFVSVTDFGAGGNASSDDTDAIQAAMSAHDRVYFPAGVYKISSPLSFSNHQELFGESKGGLNGKSKLLLDGSNVGFESRNKGKSGTYHPIFRNLTINNLLSPEESKSIGIDLKDTSFAVIENCSFRNHFAAVRISGDKAGYYNNLIGNEYSSCTHGIYMGTDGGGNSNRILGGRIHSCRVGIYADACNDNFITCAIENCETGIMLGSKASSFYIFCRFEGNGDTLTRGDTITNPRGAGILIRRGSSNNRISGHFSSGGDRVIDLDGRNFFEARGSGYTGVHQFSMVNMFWNECLSIDSDGDGLADGLFLGADRPRGIETLLSTAAGDFYSGTRGQKIVVNSAGSSRRDIRVAAFSTTPGQTYVFATRLKLNVSGAWSLRSSSRDYGSSELSNIPLTMINDWGIVSVPFKADSTAAYFYFYMANSIAHGGGTASPTLLLDAIWFGPGQVAPTFGNMPSNGHFPTFPNNTAAVKAGLPPGTQYATSTGEVRIVV